MNFKKFLIFLIFCMFLAVLSYSIGVKSAIDKNKAYFATKEIKVVIYHKYNQLKNLLQVKRNLFNKKTPGVIKLFYANDFTLGLTHLDDIENSEKTAGFILDNGNIIKYEQADIDKYWEEWSLSDFMLNANPTRFRGGGLKQIFQHKDQTFIFASLKNGNECYFASLINITKRHEIFRTPCLPKVDEIDFSSIGGAWVSRGNGILLSVGTPSDTKNIASLAQDTSSPYGKILYFSDSRLTNKNNNSFDFTVQSIGHRNPQGMTNLSGLIFSIDHGAKGGDEINLIEDNGNYGWPIYSLGSSYQGSPFKVYPSGQKINSPLYSFIPSVAPSDIIECPKLLSERYSPLRCVLITTLRGQSLIIGTINNKNQIASFEKIEVGMRLREFLFLPDGGLAVSTDDYGVFEISILDMAKGN